MKYLKRAKSAVLTVGDGRGFVVKSRGEPVVITGAHCLPFFPPCTGGSYLHKRTYQKVLAPLGSKPTIWAECLFVDPIADIAVLGCPDNQELSDEADAYEALVEAIPSLAIIDPPKKGRAWLLSLAGDWFECTFEILNDGPLFISRPSQPIRGGCPAHQSCRTAGRQLERFA